MTLIVKVEGIESGKPIDAQFASCIANGAGATEPSANHSPVITWTGAPANTESFAVMVVDRDVPADFSLVNVPEHTIAEDAPRKSFFHWLMIDIPPVITRLDARTESYGQKGRNSFGERARGANGYDGPCPPFNDARVHTYHFLVYALGINSLGLADGFSGEQVEAAIKGHILAQGGVSATYTTNPDLILRTVA